MLAESGLSDRVLFTGYVAHTEVPAWLSMFDILVLPSETQKNWKEQFGRVIVEANACGTPVIGTHCGEIPAVLGHTGGGLIVPEFAPDEFAAALRALITDPCRRSEIGKQGQIVAAREYDQRFLAARFAEAISRNVNIAD
jgi:glycosyltransferase involved in cell wall biosynthesis